MGRVIRVDELAVGDQVFTPASRWETVAAIDAATWLVRVFTDRTGPAYSWSLPRHRELPGLRVDLVQIKPAVRIESTQRGLVAFIGTEEYVDGWASYVLVDATPLGRGAGWEVRDRPSGGEVARLQVPSKAEALTAVRRAARAHAAALGLRLHRGGGEAR
jgi:hypothetical protein